MNAARYVGARVKRVEDPGSSPVAAPTSTTSCCRACCTRFIRSPFARAAVREIDASAALAVAGVRFVFTAADLNADVKEQWHTSIGPREPRDAAPAARRGRSALRRRPGRARRRREPRIAEDAAELVDVDYEPLPAVVDYTIAEHADELVHASHGSNVVGEIAGRPESASKNSTHRRRTWCARRSTSRRARPRRSRAWADRGRL